MILGTVLLALAALGMPRADARVTSSRQVRSAVGTTEMNVGNGLTLTIARYRDPRAWNDTEIVFRGTGTDGEGEAHWLPSRYSFDFREPWHARVAFSTILPKRGRLAVDLYWTGTSAPTPKTESYTTYALLRPVVLNAYAKRPARVRGEINLNGRKIPVDVRGEMIAAAPFV